MEILYEKYQNIQLFITKYRKFTLMKDDDNADEKFLNYADFKKKMQISTYVLHKCFDPVKNVNTDIIVIKHDSQYLKTPFFKKLMNKYRQQQVVYVFTKEDLGVYVRKAIKSYPNIQIHNYLFKHFTIELNKGPLCSTHTILTPEETKRVCYNVMAHGHKLPAISVNDPQNMWIGGEINDIIKIESYSEITGKAIRYRIVTPISGKTQQAAVEKVDDPDADPEAKDEKQPSPKKLVKPAEESEEDMVSDYEE